MSHIGPTTVIVGIFTQSCGATMLARVLGVDGDIIVQADVTSIACKVIDLSDYSTVITPSITVSAVVYNTLQTDDRWGIDATGFNFAHEVPATAFPNYGRQYEVQYLVTPASGAVYKIGPFRGPASRTY